MRLVLIAVVVPIALAGCGLAGLFLYQRHLVYPRAFGGRRPPTDRAVPGMIAVSLETADGERLFAFWRPPEPGCGVVLSFHGNGSLPEGHAARFGGEPWRSRGWGVLAPAYRGYPGSTGSPSEHGLIADGTAALRFVEAAAPGAPILLHGHSLGAAVAVAVGERMRPLGLYLEAPFDSLLHLVQIRFPLLPSALLRDPWRSDLRIAGSSGPVVVVHGDDDPVIPWTLAKRLSDLAGPAAQFHRLPGDHVSVLGRLDPLAEPLFRPTQRCDAVRSTN